MLPLLSLEVHDQLFVDVKGEVIVIVGNQANYCCVICIEESVPGDQVGGVPGNAVMGEQGVQGVQEGAEHAPLLRIS